MQTYVRGRDKAIINLQFSYLCKKTEAEDLENSKEKNGQGPKINKLRTQEKHK